MKAPSSAEVKAVMTIVLAIAEAIRELREVPSGELYATLMPVMPKMSIGDYQRVIDHLIGAGLVREDNHLLIWTGPAREVAR
jgi:hypothetical protein